MSRVYVRNLYGGLRVPVWLVRRAVEKVLQAYRKQGPVSVVFVSARRMRTLNRKFTGRDEPTDVLAFPIRGPKDPPETPLGEIYINANAVLETAKELNIPENIEGVFLAVHGVLHLVGFKDRTAAQRRRMLKAQLDIMAELGYHASIVDALRRSLR